MEEDFLKFSKIIQEVEELIDEHFNKINQTIQDTDLQNIFRKYDKYKEEHKKAGFNIFNLISEKYYYENLHSDIICAFLDKNGEHEEGDKFLRIFIELLQRLNPELGIDLEDFKDSHAIREKNKIDILIQDKKTKKAIIIENKINNAIDTKRQLPTYVDKIGLHNVVAIVYLPLDAKKEPCKEDWTQKEREFIDPKLIKLPAYNRDKNDDDFYNGWLNHCIEKAKNDDVKTILKQYSKLIQKIGGFMMDKDLYEQFYDKATSQKNFFKTALSIKEFVDHMPVYRAGKLYDVFLKEGFAPFKKLRVENNVVAFEGYLHKERTFKIDIRCEHFDKYEVRFWDEKWEDEIDGKKAGIKFISQLVCNIKVTNFQQREENDDYAKWFDFPNDEQKLYSFIRELKKELDKIQNNKLTLSK